MANASPIASEWNSGGGDAGFINGFNNDGGDGFDPAHVSKHDGDDTCRK